VSFFVPTRLILVRHGATAANVSRPYTLQGSRPDAEFNYIGMRQAEAAGRALAAFRVAKVYSSPLKRALATAELIAAPLAAPVEVVGGLIEADVGAWAGLTWEEIARRWPAEHATFHADPERHGYLGGENLAQVRDRVLPVIAKLVAGHPDETIVLVAHGVVNRVLLAHWQEMPLRDSRRIPQDNGGYSIVEVSDGKARIVTLNATAHLTAIPAAA
jgi:broad specificity phosphatase PhoE